MAESAVWYALGCLAGAASAAAWARLTGERIPGLEWLPAVLGVMESAIVITLVGWTVSGALAFAGLWIAARAFAGWRPAGHAVHSSRVAGSAIPVLLALVFGYLVRKSLAA